MQRVMYEQEIEAALEGVANRGIDPRKMAGLLVAAGFTQIFTKDKDVPQFAHPRLEHPITIGTLAKHNLSEEARGTIRRTLRALQSSAVAHQPEAAPSRLAKTYKWYRYRDVLVAGLPGNAISENEAKQLVAALPEFNASLLRVYDNGEHQLWEVRVENADQFIAKYPEQIIKPPPEVGFERS